MEELHLAGQGWSLPPNRELGPQVQRQDHAFGELLIILCRQHTGQQLTSAAFFAHVVVGSLSKPYLCMQHMLQ